MTETERRRIEQERIANGVRLHPMGGLMPFQGHELFPIKQNGQLIKKPLSDFDDWEVILVANMLRNDGCDEGADMWLDYLQRRRAAATDPGPQAA